VIDYCNIPTEVQKYITIGDERGSSSNQPSQEFGNLRYGLEKLDGRVIWDALSTLKTRGRYSEGPSQRPMDKTSHKGQLYACSTLATLEMCETPSWELEEGNTLTLRKIEDFLWFPKDNRRVFGGPAVKASPEDDTAKERSRNPVHPSVKPAVNRILEYDTSHNVQPLVTKGFDSRKRLGPGFRLPSLPDYQGTMIQLVVRTHTHTQPVIKWCKSQSFHKNNKRGAQYHGWRRFRRRRIGKTAQSCHRLDPSHPAVRTLSPSRYHRLELSDSAVRALSPSLVRGTGQETGILTVCKDGDVVLAKDVEEAT